MVGGCPSLPGFDNASPTDLTKQILNQPTLGGECSNYPDLDQIAQITDIVSTMFTIRQWSSQPPVNGESNSIGNWGVEQAEAFLPIDGTQLLVENPVPGGGSRIYDGQLTDGSRYVEVKTSLNSKVSISLDRRIRREVKFDSEQAIKPLWVFVAKSPSRGVRNLLDKYEIPWIVLNGTSSEETK